MFYIEECIQCGKMNYNLKNPIFNNKLMDASKIHSLLIQSLFTLKIPITIAADNNICNITLCFQGKIKFARR